MNFMKYLNKRKWNLFSIICVILTFSMGVSAQIPAKLQVLLPGMSAAPGTQMGYTGSPISQTTGVPFDVIINAVDENWNVVASSDQVSATSSDPFANLPLPANLNNGTLILSFTMNSSGNHSIAFDDDTNQSVLNGHSPTFQVVDLKSFRISDIGDPWWLIPGQVKVGRSLRNVQITARDENGNKVNNYNGTVNLAQHTDDGIGRISPETVQLVNGEWVGTLRVYRAGNKSASWGVTGDVWVEVTDSAPTAHSGQSNRFCASPDDFEKLLTVVPGEAFLPGSVTGRMGTPVNQQGDQPFQISIYATDQYWNKIKSIGHSILLTSTDPAAVLGPYGTLSGGMTTMAVRLLTSGVQTITASDVTDSNKDPHTSSEITVISQGLHHFTFNAISSPRTAGEAFPVIITAVNEQGSIVSDFNGTLDLIVSTGNSTLSPTEINMTNGWWSGDVTLTKAASLITLSLQDRTDPPHTGESNQFDVVAAQVHQLQVLLPGETATPGIAPGKSGEPGEILSGSSIQVRINAVDAWWNVISGNSDVVHLTSSDPVATLPSDASLNSGTRQVIVTMSSTGLQTITASDQTNGSVAPNTSSLLRVNPGNFDHFVFNPINGPVTAGTPFQVTIIAADAVGNPVNAFSGVVNLESVTGPGTVSPTQLNFNNGQWNGNVTITKASGSAVLSVSDAANPPHVGSSNQFTVNTGAFAKLQVLVPGIAATPGLNPGFSGTAEAQNGGVPFSIMVNAVDANWNVISTVNDSFAVSSTDILASNPEATTFFGGSRNLSITLNSEGGHTISAVSLNIPGITNGQSPTITVLPSNLDHFSISQITGPIVAGEPVALTIRAETNTNTTVTGFNSTVSLTASSGAGTVSPATVGPFVNGEWSGTIQLSKAESNVTMTASDGATPAHEGLSNPFTVVPGVFNKLQVLLPGENATPGVSPGKNGLPNDQQTGIQFNVLIQAVDANWNLVNSISDSVKLFSTDSLALFSERSKMTSGKATFTSIMGLAGTHTFTAFDISDESKLSGLSSAFNVNPGNLDHFVFDTISEQIAGNAFSVKITAVDGAGSPVAGFNGHAKIQSSTGLETVSPTEIVFVDGVWQGTITVTKSGSQVKLTCLDFAAIPHQGQSNGFIVNAGEFVRLQIILPGETATPGVAPGKIGEVKAQITGDAFLVQVAGVDRFWNPVPTASGNVGLASTDGNANLPVDAALQAGSAAFTTFRFGTPGYWTVTAHFRTNGDISSDTSPLVHVITGSVASFSFDAITSPQTAGDTIFTTIRAIDGSGETVSNYNEQANITASTGPGTIFSQTAQFVDGEWSGPVVLTKAAISVHLNIHDFADVVRGNSNPFTLVAGELEKIHFVLAGETATPGLAPGRSGSPGAQIAGVPFSSEIRLTDKFWNAVAPQDTTWLTFAATDPDPEIILPADTFMTAAQENFDFTLLSEGENKLAVQSTGTEILSDTSSVFYLDSGQLHHFEFSQIDTVQTAGAAFVVRITAMNQHGNPVTAYDSDIILSASTGNGTLSKSGVTLSEGYWQGELICTRADEAVVIYAADYVAPPNTHSGFSNPFVVVPDSLAGLQVLLPGETATPGVEPGKKGEPMIETAGEETQISVRAVDQFWNRISSVEDTISLAATDSFTVFPSGIYLQNGEVIFDVIFRAARLQKIYAKLGNEVILPATPAKAGAISAIQNENLPLAESAEVTVIPNSFSELLMLLPGELVLAGDTETDPQKSPGRSGEPTKQTSGLPFEVIVVAVDAYWNPVYDTPANIISLFATDNQAEIDPVQQPLQNGRADFQVTLTQGGSQVLHANNESNQQMTASLDGVVDVLLGGLHYEIVVDSNKIVAGESFSMQVYYRNGIGQEVVSANQLIQLTAVNANNLDEEVGTLSNASFNLQAGQRDIDQIFNRAGWVRIRVTDDLATEIAYSDPILFTAGDVSTLLLSADKTEIGGLKSTEVQVELLDAAGNPVTEKEVSLQVISGSGELSQVQVISDSTGKAATQFTGGRITETNTIVAEVDSVYAELDIIVNLTSSDLPDGVAINYPNPFGQESKTTRIDYYLAEDADVTLTVYDLFGRKVWKTEYAAGSEGGRGRAATAHPNSVEWNGTNGKGQKVGNGGYILVAQARANGKTIMNMKRKIVIVR
ncbi:MAG: hypothetical protein DWQ05_16460 [Calditrichaeota bacterium]|nr:MAG: hypothetical protein DWQ05_16460 [Calditrichota bacterium]